MATKLQVRHGATGDTLYAVFFRDGQVWDGVDAAMESVTDAQWANYTVTMTEEGTASQVYTVTAPSGLSAGDHDAFVFKQAGGSPAITDLLVAQGSFGWDGSALVELNNVGGSSPDVTDILRIVQAQS